MADVESVASSVVREYLSRKGLKETLAMMDIEMPRMENCISNRAQLAKELHINSLMKKNKENKESFRTMLEVIVQFMMTKTWQQKHSVEKSLEPAKSSSTTSLSARDDCENNEKTNRNNCRNERSDSVKIKRRSETKQLKNQVASQTLTSSLKDEMLSEHDTIKNDGDVNIHAASMSISDRLKTTSLSCTTDDKVQDKTSTSIKQSTKEQKNSQSLFGKTNEVDNNLGNDPLVNKNYSFSDSPSIQSSITRKRSQRNVSSTIISTGHHRKQERRNNTKQILREKPKYFEEDFKESLDHHAGKTLQNITKSEDPFSQKNERTNNKNTKKDFRENPKYFEEDVKESLEKRPSEKIEKTFSVIKKEESEKRIRDWKKEILENKDVRKNISSSQLTKTKSEDLIFEDIDDDFDDGLHKLSLNVSPRKSTMSMFYTKPITLKQAKDLKTIVFGSTVSTFNSEWRNQGFTFCHFDHLNYGIIQHKGGPCGLLASVQAVVLKQLLFSDRFSHNTQRLHFSSQETNDALLSALVEIIWRAGSHHTARVAIRSEKDQFIPSGGYKADRLTEKLLIYETNNLGELEIFMKDNLRQFSSDDGGCILLLYSVILSRTVDKIKEDMDDQNGTLMGAHGYCTQDMVNLLLTGKAISNTFDNVIELDSGGHTKSILKGVGKQSDIGLLSLFEHYKSCLVGSNLKTPKYPIWVVCSESHFSVLFSTKRSLLNERRSPRKFDLYYYDGLAGQTEEIRLTIDICDESIFENADDDLISPLEHCIRTRWKDAVIDWNGTEPLL